jgi:glucosamine-6-phosphate deaminase
MLTGELNDPHGTHTLCAQVFELAANEYSIAGGKPFQTLALSRAWDEFETWQGDYFSVFGKDILERKVEMILDHISQLEPMFPGGSDPREFYERARDRKPEHSTRLATIGRAASVALLRPALRRGLQNRRIVALLSKTLDTGTTTSASQRKL